MREQPLDLRTVCMRAWSALVARHRYACFKTFRSSPSVCKSASKREYKIYKVKFELQSVTNS